MLARPEDGVSPGELTRRITAATELRARTANQFRLDCVCYYLANTGIPVNFGITIAVGLLVGLVVSGQTFYLFTVENLKQFVAEGGTLITMGNACDLAIEKLPIPVKNLKKDVAQSKLFRQRDGLVP